MDVYPVTVTLADGSTHSKAKARIDGAGVTVWVWDPEAASGAVLYQSADVVQESPRRWLSGDVTIAKAKGCGCGSGNPLKRWVPPEGNVAVAS